MSLADTAPAPTARARAKATPRRAPAKPRKAAAKKAPRKKTAPAKPRKAVAEPPAAQAPETWTAQFVYAAADGSARVSLMTIEAKSLEAARAYAAAHAPAAEFMLSLHPRSDEQFLGQVRHRALAAVKRPR